jgi:protein-S-isoprenylcysteine O-methyltransferase Ste14
MKSEISLEKPETRTRPDVAAAIKKRLVQVVIQFLILIAILFISSGRLDWGWAWAYIGVGVGILAINVLVVLPRHPEMIAERGKTKKEETKDWDTKITSVITILTLAQLVGAGLDERFGWSPALTPGVQIAALIFAALGHSIFSWAMASNRFFATTVRIQTDRSHAVETGGPYRYVRHPGYSGMILSLLMTPLMLGSLWALIPGALAAALYVVRTAFEDRTLQEELHGYREFAQRTRYRLVPGVW